MGFDLAQRQQRHTELASDLDNTAVLADCAIYSESTDCVPASEELVKI
jgi:hypothetical protein